MTAAFSKWPRNELSGETELLEAHLIVVADATILLNAEDLGHIDAWNGDEGDALLFRAAARLRRIGRDVLDPRMRQRADNLRPTLAIDLPPAAGVSK